MEIQKLMPRRGPDTLRIGDSDDLVVMENISSVPVGEVSTDNHAIVVICTEGRAQFEYDGTVILLKKNDMFLYMSHSVACNFMASPDFNCRQIWFIRKELWNISIYADTSFADIAYLKLQPIVHLNDDDVKLLDTYFHFLCRRMREPSPVLHRNIVRSLVSTMMLEMLAMMRRDVEKKRVQDELSDTLPDVHKRRLVDNFTRLVEKSDGRTRRVSEFAKELNVTPKYLSTILKETIKRRPSDIISLFTLKAIEHRLRFSDMTMQEIAYDLNFPNASFFGKYYRERTGQTPLEYRNTFHL